MNIHKNAPMTPTGREAMVRAVLDGGLTHAAGQIDFMIEPSSNFQALVKAGTIKAPAVTSAERIDSYPSTPTAEEAGLPGFQTSLWYGLWVWHGTPEPVIAKLNHTMRETLADPEIGKRLTTLGIHITPTSKQAPGDLRAFQKAEAERWWPIIKAAHIQHQ